MTRHGVSVVALRIGVEFRDRIGGSDDDIVIILRGIAPGGQLGGYRTALKCHRNIGKRC